MLYGFDSQVDQDVQHRELHHIDAYHQGIECTHQAIVIEAGRVDFQMAMGQDTRDVLKELGYTAEQIDAMIAAGEATDVTRIG